MKLAIRVAILASLLLVPVLYLTAPPAPANSRAGDGPAAVGAALLLAVGAACLILTRRLHRQEQRRQQAARRRPPVEMFTLPTPGPIKLDERSIWRQAVAESLETGDVALDALKEQGRQLDAVRLALEDDRRRIGKALAYRLPALRADLLAAIGADPEWGCAFPDMPFGSRCPECGDHHDNPARCTYNTGSMLVGEACPECGAAHAPLRGGL